MSLSDLIKNLSGFLQNHLSYWRLSCSESWRVFYKLLLLSLVSKLIMVLTFTSSILKEHWKLIRLRDHRFSFAFLDASKAFHRLNQRKLFEDFTRRREPMYLVQLISHWYANQPNAVKRGNTTATAFSTTNGISQGGLVSPSLYNNY